MEELNKNRSELQPAENAAENSTAQYSENLSEKTPQENANPFANNEQTNFYTDGLYLSPVYVSQKRGINPLAIILPAAAVVIAAVVVFILLMLNKPASYREAEMNYFNSLFSAAGQTESDVEGISAKTGSEKLTVDFSTPLGSIADIDLSQYRLEIDTVNGEHAAYAVIKAIFGEMNLTAEMWMDRESSKNYIFLPEISDIYAVMDYSTTKEDSEEYLHYSEALNRVFEKTSEVYFEIIGDPEIEKDVQFTVNNTSYTADRADIHLDMKQIALLAKTLLENMDAEPDTADLLCKIGEYDSLEEMREWLNEGLEMFQNVIDGTETADGSVDMTVYMKNNTVIARTVTINDNDADSAVTFNIYNIPMENGEYVYFSVMDNGAESYDLSYLAFSYDDSNVNGSHSGTVNLTVNYGFTENVITVNADYKDVSVTDDSFGGAIDLSISGAADYFSGSDSGDVYSAKITLSKEGDKKITTVTVPNICTVNFTAEPSDLEFKAVPSPSPDKTAVLSGDFEDDNGALNQLLEDISDYLFPDFGTDLYEPYEEPMVPEKEEAVPAAFGENAQTNKPVSESGVIGTWKPVKMTLYGEEYDSSVEGFADAGDFSYTFSADGVLTITYDTENDLYEEYEFYLDDNDDSRIFLKDDIYSVIYYDKGSDTVTVSDESGIVSILLGRIN